MQGAEFGSPHPPLWRCLCSLTNSSRVLLKNGSPGTELWGKKLTPEERQERERLLQEEEEEEKKNELREKEMQDAERRKYQSAGEERRMQEREQVCASPVPVNHC